MNIDININIKFENNSDYNANQVNISKIIITSESVNNSICRSVLRELSGCKKQTVKI